MKPRLLCVRFHVLLLSTFFAAGYLSAQSVISGIINTYTAVTSIDYAARRVTIADASGFAAGDKVLLIQMQGADINTTNTFAYGTINALNGCGDYELGQIRTIQAGVVELEGNLVHTYVISGRVQLVRVPVYGEVTVTDTLRCRAWDGTTGGIIALIADCLTLDRPIDASGAGFRGRRLSQGPLCSYNPNTPDYVSVDSCKYSPKGEGLVGFGMLGGLYGKGAPANGGGGGNNHNAGGGGGGNMGAGGRGGSGYTPFGNPQVAAGLGAYSLTPWYAPGEGRMFMGGAGGCGHINNDHGSGGANGGGLVFIKAGRISGAGARIMAKGVSAANDPAPTDPDGCGGGGGGGTVMLDVASITGLLTVDVAGGNGGSRLGTGLDVGPGGGGGGGMVAVTGDTAGVTCLRMTLDGGKAGTGVGDGTFNATDGSSGGVITGYKVHGTIPTVHACSAPEGCALLKDVPPPVLTSVDDDCYGLIITAKDSVSAITSILLDSSASENVSIHVLDGLPSNAVSIRVTVVNRNQGGKVRLQVQNVHQSVAVIEETLLGRTASQLVVEALPEGSLHIDTTDLMGRRCAMITLRNRGTTAMVIPEGLLYHNTAFIVSPGQFPMTIPAGETRECEICFEPRKVGPNNDTLFINDVFCPLFIPMSSFSTLQLQGESCGTVINIRVTGELLSKVVVSGPYPNPSGTTMRLPVTILGDPTAGIVRPPVVSDELGHVVATPSYEPLSSSGSGNRYREEGRFTFDLGNLPQGTYWLTMTTNEGVVTYQVVVGR